MVLLDLRPQENKFMTINQAIDILLGIQEKRKEKTIVTVIGCARLGNENPAIKFGTAKDLKDFDFGKPPHCLIIPGKMHFAEEEFVGQFNA